MRSDRRRSAVGRLAIGFVIALLALLPVTTWGAAAPSGDMKGGEAAAAPQDSLGRTTPYGTVFGFVRAMDRGNYQLAAKYLEVKQGDTKNEELARKLSLVLNRGLKIRLEDLSRIPEGRLDDDPLPNLELIGTARYGDDSLDILLRRSPGPEGPSIWLFSSGTLRKVGAAADGLDYRWGEDIWPESFREVSILSIPVNVLLNQLVIVPLMLLIAWLVRSAVILCVRPLLHAIDPETGAQTVASLRLPLLLLFFALVVLLAAPYGITVSGRIIYNTSGSLLLIVAVCWLLVVTTICVNRLKVRQIRRGASPGNISMRTLGSWVLISVWVAAGLLLAVHTLGFDATTALAGLGVGGIAVAFAAQKSIENLFGTLMVIAEDTIEVGDRCRVGTVDGWVENIGLRSTVIRTVDRTLASIPNGHLASMTVENLRGRDRYLFRHMVRLSNETMSGQLGVVLEQIRSLMASHPKIDQAMGPRWIRLVRLGEYSFDIEVSVYLATRADEEFREIQEDLLLRIRGIVEGAGVQFARPAQTIHFPEGHAIPNGAMMGTEAEKSAG